MIWRETGSRRDWPPCRIFTASTNYPTFTLQMAKMPLQHVFMHKRLSSLPRSRDFEPVSQTTVRCQPDTNCAHATHLKWEVLLCCIHKCLGVDLVNRSKVHLRERKFNSSSIITFFLVANHNASPYKWGQGQMGPRYHNSIQISSPSSPLARNIFLCLPLLSPSTSRILDLIQDPLKLAFESICFFRGTFKSLGQFLELLLCGLRIQQFLHSQCSF